MKEKSIRHINKIVALISMIIGGISWPVCRHIYTAYHSSLSGPLMIGVLFAILFAVIFIAVLTGSLLTGSFDMDSMFYRDAGGMILYFVCGAAAVFLLSMLMEYLYEISPSFKEIEPTSYVFVIDESGSMGGNDRTGLRYEAISEIMEKEANNFPYMVYTFSNDSEIVREMAPASKTDEEIPITCEGDTSIRGTILRILQDYKEGVWDGGENPKIIFLTDGYATDLDNGFLWFKGNVREFNEALDEYSSLGINISTVGLGFVDRQLMTKIAETTGGIFVNVQNAADLAEAMKTAAASYSERDLLSIRYMRQMDAIYGLLRILFLTIIGAVIGSLVLLAYMEDSSIPLLIFSSLICSFFGSLLFETGLKVGVFQSILWLILWVLFSLTLGYFYPKDDFKQTGASHLIQRNDKYLHIR